MGLTLLILILVILLDNLRRLRKGLPPPRVLDKCVAFAEKFLPHLRSSDEVELKSAFEKTEDGLQTVPSSSEFWDKRCEGVKWSSFHLLSCYLHLRHDRMSCCLSTGISGHDSQHE